MAAADLNGDGKLDVAVVNQQDNTVDLYQGDGAGGFTLSKTLGASDGIGTIPDYVLATDVNGDGVPDLIVISQGDATFDVLLNLGSFNFYKTVFETSGSNPYWVASGDFNRDGYTDLAVINNGAGTVDVYLGDGTGVNFPPTSGSPISVGSNPTAIVAADFNNDGKLDLAITNGGSTGNTVTILLGNGDGSFQAASTISGAGASPLAIAAGDINGDGKVDLAIADQGTRSATVAILLGDGTGNFTPAMGSSYALSGTSASSVAIADFNNDGRPDIAVATSAGISVLLTESVLGTPRIIMFSATTDTGVAGPPGIIDAVTEPAGAIAFSATSNQTWLRATPANGTTPANLTVSANSAGLAAGTYTGAIQLTANPLFPGLISVVLNVTNPSGTLTANTPIALNGTGAQGIVTGDFTGDRIPDLAIANQSSNTVTVLKGIGNGSFSTFLSPFAAGTAPTSIAIGDFNHDGILDMAVASHQGSKPVTVFKGNGDGTFSAFPGGPIPAGSSGPGSVVAADFDGDGNLDLALANSLEAVSLLLGNGSGGFTPASGSPFSTGSTGISSIVTGDFNGDGRPDVAVANQGGSNVSVLLGGAGGGFTAAPGSPFSAGSGTQGLAVGDFNRDGKLDLVAANAGANTVTVLLGNGSGGFSQASGSPYGVAQATAVVVTDVDGDGNQDIVSLGSSGQASILLGNGSGGFFQASLSSFTAGNQLASAVAGDFNGDGRVDLVFSDSQNNTANVFLGNSAATTTALTTTAPPTVPAGTSIPLTVQVSDNVRAFASPRGTVTFADGEIRLATLALSSGVATYTSTYGVGTHTFTASYTGDNRSSSSTSVPLRITVLATPASVTAMAGTGQTANVGATFSTSLQAIVKDSAGNSLSGISVTFTAPQTGASGTFAGGSLTATVTTNAAGVAIAPTFTANNVAGSYIVTASVAGVNTPATFNLTNTGGIVTSLPASVNFTVTANAASVPASQSLSLTGSGAVSFMFSAASASNFFAVSASGSTTPASMTVSLLPSAVQLTPGSYSGTITIQSATSTTQVPVNLTVMGVLSASTNNLSFSAFVGGSSPAPRSIALSGTDGLSFSVQTSAPWLSVSPAAGTLPATISVAVSSSGYSPGSYVGSVIIVSPYAGTTSVAVQLTVQPALDIVTSPVTLSLSGGTGNLSGDLPIVSSSTGAPFTATASGPGGLSVSPSSGTLPAVLRVSVNTTSLLPGNYSGSVTLTVPDANPSTRIIPVMFTVAPPQPVQISTQAPGLTFGISTAAPQTTRQVIVANLGASGAAFQASADQSWIHVTPNTGSAGDNGATQIAVGIDLTGFGPGTYNATITVASATNAVHIPVHVSVSSAVALTLSQIGLTFTAVAGGPAPPPESLQALSTGATPLAFDVSTSVASGDGNWLFATPASGRTDTNAAIQVSVNPSGLAPGAYYGQVVVSAPGSPPQSATIVLNVNAPGTTLTPVVQPTGIVFTAISGGANPDGQSIVISNPGTTAVRYVSTPMSNDSTGAFSYSPASGEIEPGQSQTITVQALPNLLSRTLGPGVYRAQIDFGFVGLSAVRPVELLLVVVRGSQSATARSRPEASSVCTPTQLLPVFTQLGNNFSVPAAWPQPLEVRVVDDCAKSIANGSVIATFSNGDPALSLKTLGDGRWAATWVARNVAATTITATASELVGAGKISGSAQISGTTQANAAAPVVASGGVVNAASFAGNTPLPPGALVTIFGSHLADQTASAGSLPLPNQLASTTAVIDGAPVPLLYTSDGQLNAVLPFGLQQNVMHQLIVSRGSTISVPEPITVSSAEPAIFSASGTGSGQGIVLSVLPDGTQLLADANHPAGAGEYIVIYAAGLGPVTPSIVDGVAAPAAPLSTVARPISLKIGGVDATIAFAGLAPGFVGLYQVNAIVPQTASGNSVPVVVTVDGQDSPPVTMAIR